MIDNLFKRLLDIELFISSVVFISALVVLSLNIILRQGFNSSLTWAEEYMRYSVIWVTFMGTSLCVEDNMHVGIDVFVQMSPNWLRKALYSLGMLCATFFCGYMVEFSMRNTMLLFSTMQRSPIMQLPMGFIYISMPIGMFFTALRFGRKAFYCIVKKTADYADKPKAIESIEEIDMLKLD